jgi:hypothetical protein
MASVAGELEALILITVPGHAAEVPVGLPGADLAVRDVRLIPITDAVRARWRRAAQDDEKIAGFRELTQGIVEQATRLSRDWVVVYVHCEFWAGEGVHAAIAWRRGAVIFGPCFTRTPGESAEAPYETADPPDMAINAALRAVGIVAEPSADEFETVGLDRYRWTSEWEAQQTGTR